MTALAPPNPGTDVPTPLAWSWRLTWRGQSWTDSDLTGQHLAALAMYSGDDRFANLAVSEDEIRALPHLGFMRLINLLRSFATVAAVDGIDDANEAATAEAVVLHEIRRASADEILGCVEFRSPL